MVVAMIVTIGEVTRTLEVAFGAPATVPLTHHLDMKQ